MLGMKNQLILLILGVFMLEGCAVRSPNAQLTLAHPPSSTSIATSAPIVRSVLHRKTKIKSLFAHLRLGLSQKTVQHRIGRADELFVTPLSMGMAGWTYETVAYRCADGTLWVEYADSPPTQDPNAALVTYIGGPTFDIGRHRP